MHIAVSIGNRKDPRSLQLVYAEEAEDTEIVEKVSLTAVSRRSVNIIALWIIN